MDTHEIHTVRGFEKVERFTLRVWFEDGTEQLIDFEPVLAGEIFEPLRDPEYFARVRLDEEIGTLTWPNGADLDLDVLYSVVTGEPIDLASDASPAGEAA